MRWLWEIQKHHELKEEARKALYRAFHVQCTVADYLGPTWMKMTDGMLHFIYASRVNHIWCSLIDFFVYELLIKALPAISLSAGHVQ